MSHRLLLVTLLAAPALVLTPSLALAQTEAADSGGDFDDRVSAALEHYRAGRYLAAIEDFEAAYALRPRPELIYNIGRSYEKALRRDEAVAAYERFLELPGTTADLRTKALDALAALRRERAARERATAAEQVSTSDRAPGRAVSGVEAARPGRSRALEWTLVGSGAVVAGAGAVFGVLALQDESALQDAQSRGEPRTELEKLADDTKTKALVADVLYGVGAATAVTGLIVFLVTGDDASDVALGPAAHRDGGGLVLTGRF